MDEEECDIVIPIVEPKRDKKDKVKNNQDKIVGESNKDHEYIKIWKEFVNDDTQYELSDKSDESEDDIDENYDSFYFQEAYANNIKHKSSRLVTCKNKLIAKWAGNKETINKLIIYQKEKLNPDKIFGRLTADTIELNEVFDRNYTHPDVRGSSANWKNEYWTPLSPTRAREITRDEKDPVENLDGKFKLSQTCDSPDFGEQINTDVIEEIESSYDILEQ